MLRVVSMRGRGVHNYIDGAPVATPCSLNDKPLTAQFGDAADEDWIFVSTAMRGRGVRDYIDGAPVATPCSLNDKPLTAQFGDAADEDWIFVPDSRLRRDRRTCN